MWTILKTPNKTLKPLISLLRKITFKACFFAFISLSWLYIFLSYAPYNELLSPVEYIIWFIPVWLITAPLLGLALFYKQWGKKSPLIVFTAVIFYFHLDGLFIPAENLLKIKPSDSAHSTSLNVMTINLGSRGINETVLQSELDYSDIDILSMQEGNPQRIKQLLKEQYNVACEGKLCVASKFEIKHLSSLDRKGLGRQGIFASIFEIKLPSSVSLYFMNVHFETPRRGIEGAGPLFLNPKAIFKNSANRYLEINLACSAIQRFEPVIIAGDFNTTQNSSIYRECFDYYTNAFADSGLGNGSTKHTRLLGARIDHILTSSTITIESARIGVDVNSDHLPVIATIKL